MQEDLFLVKELSVSNQDRFLLKPISFSIKRGEWLSIIGPNGAGKSTLLKALSGVLVSKSEGIFLGSKRLDLISQKERACYLCYVPQRFEPLVPFSVRKFLELALYADIMPQINYRVDQALELFRLNSYESRSIQELSIGELQRVLLAAAFVQGSEVLLLDEPSSALDPFEEVEMIKTLNELKRSTNRTIFYVTHNLSTAFTFADKVLMLKGGELLKASSPEDILLDQSLEKIYGQKFLVSKDNNQISICQSFI